MAEEKRHPQEIVIDNARILVHAKPEDRNKLFKQSLKYVIGQIKGKDFTKDINALIGVQIQLSSVSLAIEYWLAKLKEGKIKVYDASQMPKA